MSIRNSLTAYWYRLVDSGWHSVFSYCQFSKGISVNGKTSYLPRFSLSRTPWVGKKLLDLYLFQRSAVLTTNIVSLFSNISPSILS